MAALPSPTQVAGSHVDIYEAYYNQVDPNGCGCIEAMNAARFLKKSQLSDIILSKIWDMADPQSRGALDKSGMFVALKLCAFAQCGRELNIANLSQDIAPPKMGELPKITQVKRDWSISPSERKNYEQLFEGHQTSNGYIAGNKVKGLLVDSKLPFDTLGKIWDLADMDKDGMLDRHEFVVAMHLVYKALQKYPIPNVLPAELMPPGKRKPSPIMGISSAAQVMPISGPPTMVPTPPIPPLPKAASAVNSLVGLEPVKIVPATPQWVVTPEDQAAAEKIFLQADMDMDGFVSGSEIKDVFLQSGLPQDVLANIWGLCDLCRSGKLNKEQFALSMWLIKRKRRDIELPTSLTPEMIPPSLRNISEAVVENNNITGYSNPELDMISKDIADMARERRAMEQDIAQKEADIKIKNGEIKSLQSELDTLAATLKQLENQRGEAQKRLNDFKAQRADVDKELSEIERETREEQDKVEKLRQQAEEQESVLRTQEEELNSKKQELEGLRQEEQQLEQQQNKSREQLNELTKNLQNTQLQISQAKAKITNLEEQQRQMSDAIAIYDSAIAAGDPTLVPDASLQFNPEIDDLDQEEKNAAKINGVGDRGDAFSNGTAVNQGFGDNEDPFSSNKAKEAFGATAQNDPFASAFDAQSSAVASRIGSAFTSDPFASTKQDPFDPFGDGKRKDGKSAMDGTPATKDPFGEDPFANLHAPTRAESPSPALPPKKAKQPPPRPAPPRPASAPGGPGGPLRAAPAPPTPSPTPDPFANANTDPFAAQQPTIDSANGNTGFMPSNTGGFADFANFDSQPEPVQSNRSSVARSSNARGRTGSSTIGSPSSGTMQSPLGSKIFTDFTEDPFENYRYEDAFAIADPFADDQPQDLQQQHKVDDALNANAFKNRPKVDAFGLETSPSRRDPSLDNSDAFSCGFESDFSKSFPLQRKAAIKNRKGFEANNAFGDANSNSNYDLNFSESFDKSTKSINFDEAFDAKNEKIGKKLSLDLPVNIKDRMTLGERKNKSNVWKNSNNSGTLTLIEQQHLAWAAQQSLIAEQERKNRIKEQEEAELARALELSKLDKTDNF